MKVKALSVLVGVSVPLILTESADAGFLGLTTTAKPNPFGLYVVNVYAEFDAVGDAFQKVGGTPGSPMNITAVGGTFWNQPEAGLPPGGDRAPHSALFDLWPSLAFDSFFTIGVKAVGEAGQPADNMTFVPGNLAGGLQGHSISTNNWSYALLGPSPQGNPFDPINCFPGDGRVLIGQFSMEIPAETPYGIRGQLKIGVVSDGVVIADDVTFSSLVPAPGALGLIGLAGLLSTRRRHR